MSKKLEDGRIVITDERDWHWYKRKLDTDREIEHEHSGEPNRFPCIVESEISVFPDGPTDYYYHSFTYQRTVKCEKCGHATEKVFDVVE
jgi:hypothetical protein